MTPSERQAAWDAVDWSQDWVQIMRQMKVCKTAVQKANTRRVVRLKKRPDAWGYVTGKTRVRADKLTLVHWQDGPLKGKVAPAHESQLERKAA